MDIWSKLFRSRSDAARSAKKIISKHLDVNDPILVTHFAYFKSAGRQQEFAAAVAGLGFHIDQAGTTEIGDFHFSVVFSALQRIDGPEFDSRCAGLSTLCESLDGDYDGWEVPVTANMPGATQ